MDGEPGNFTVSKGHGHPLVDLMVAPYLIKLPKTETSLVVKTTKP
jgi:hypothetical protein